jgi:transmembrane sensor
VDDARFNEWLASHPSHRQAFEELGSLWNRLDDVAQSPEVLAERRQLAKRRPHVRWRTVAAAALAASLIIAIGFVWWQRLYVSTEVFVTGLGEQRTIPLTDGSVVTLNTSSELRLHYSRNERRLELRSGQAVFEVEKDTERPFIVSAGSGETVALGTVFEVYKRDDDVLVTLIEGKVAIDPQRTNRPHLLQPGEQLAYGGASEEVVRKSVDVQRASAWRARKLDFVDTPLAEAIAEGNRYSRVKIELRAPGMEDAKISGVFDAGRNDSLAEGLRAYYGLRLERPGDDLIVLSEPTTD